MSDYGVIQEQGFVTGSGLGFKPVSESDQQKIKKDSDKDKKENE
jgi:hypothetical protein